MNMIIRIVLLFAFLAGAPAMAQTKLTGDGLADLRSAIADLRAQVQSLKSVQTTGSVTADLVKRLTPPTAPSTPAEIDATKCDFTIFSKLTFENVAQLLSKCAQMVNENVAAPLVNDAQHALDSATAFNNVAGDGAAIACLKPAVALLKAAEGFPAVKDAAGNVTTPAQAMGIFLIGQKLREFVEAGGPSNCKTVIAATVNGLAVSALTP